jgi:hypothetical protein
MTINVYVGDILDYLAVIARRKDPTASLITSDNYKDLKPGTYYTSIGDLENLLQFSEILRQADNIFYYEPEAWSDKKIKKWTEDYLMSFSFQPDKNIYGFSVSVADDKSTILEKSSKRQTHFGQIWVAGCSISHGVGVTNDQKYGELISKYLSTPVSYLTAPGSSNRWQADQILRSNLQKDDLLIWGLTSIARTPVWKNDKIHHINSTVATRQELVLLNSEQMTYDTVTAVYQVLNFCNKVGCKLVLASMLATGIEPYLHNCEFFIDLAGQYGRHVKELFADLGNDNSHPGPLMHQYYANQIIKKYNALYGNSN